MSTKFKPTTVHLQPEVVEWVQDQCHEMRAEMPGGFSQWLRETLSRLRGLGTLPRVPEDCREAKPAKKEKGNV